MSKWPIRFDFVDRGADKRDSDRSGNAAQVLGRGGGVSSAKAGVGRSASLWVGRWKRYLPSRPRRFSAAGGASIRTVPRCRGRTRGDMGRRGRGRFRESGPVRCRRPRSCAGA